MKVAAKKTATRRAAAELASGFVAPRSQSASGYASSSRLARGQFWRAAQVSKFICLSTSLWLLAMLAAHAQIPYENAADFFNGGAQFYISNNIPDALKRTEAGLKIYPDDAKLKELEKLLKQQQQQQQQQNQQNQKNQQKNQQNKSQQNQSQNQQSQSQNQQQKQQQNPEQNQQNQAKQQKQQKQQEQQAQQAQAMTPGEAKRLLDAQKGNEQLLQFKPQNQPQNANSPIKDW
jgi:hypothetical protein